ncbi:S8 family serine peptidase [Streptomyces sp. NPDC086010]|uniref:S8 family serine peptidase n=1 Tax=Streptomyces sp. NPDC086010 TaxID=3365745 RepID=UPI0037D146B5
MTHHHSGRRRGPLLLAAAVLVTAATPLVTASADAPSASGAATAAHSGAAATARAGRPASSVVTLLTGDKVTVAPAVGGGPGTISVQDPDGEPTGARVMTVGGDTYVYPDSVRPYLTAGLLDQRLFNVTRLVADGYDDARLDRLPLIVTYGGDELGAASLRRRGDAIPGHVTLPLTSVNGVALTAGKGDGGALWAALTGTAANAQHAKAEHANAQDAKAAFRGGVSKVWLDGKAEATLSDSVAQIGAPDVWSGGNRGEGVDVAVLDSGYDPDHPDLRGVVEDSESFVPGETVTDRNGHGTHVASTIAGSGAASDGREKGVAPGVDLHVGKVLDDSGSGYDSWIVAGMEWAARDAHARVISMSLGSNANADGETVLARSVNELSEETGALFTIAAGNSGPDARTVRSPGTADAALTVGAVDSADAIADFSSRGPRYGDDALKPEITAPGVGILAARSQYAPWGSGSYASLSGTSMATPHVAGAAALVAAAHPDWSGSRVKDALISTVRPTPDITIDDGGNGRVDAAAAVGTLTATAKADAGIHAPGGDRALVESEVVWTNTSDRAVTVDLAVDAPGVPAGVFTLSENRRTVPAHGTAAVTVRTDLARAGELQRWTGRLTASTGDVVRTRTLLGVSTRHRLGHVRTKVTGRSGEATEGVLTFFRKGDDFAGIYPYGGGVSDELLPPGRYTVYADFRVEGTHGASSAGYARMVLPQVDVTGDADLVLDGTKLREVTARTPRKKENVLRRIDYHRQFDDHSLVTDSTEIADGYDSLWTAPTPPGRDGEQYLTVRWRDRQPLLTLTSGTQEFDDLSVMPGSSSLPEGDHDLDLIHPGQGMTADYKGVDAAGKAAVVRWDSYDEDTADDQIRAAQAAGVKMLLFVHDLDGRLRQPIIRSTIQVAGLSRTEGEKLIARVDAATAPRGVRLHAVSHPRTAYLYDLVHTWKGRIPTDLTYAPKDGQLARVESHFRNPNGREVHENRYDVHPWTVYNVSTTRLSTSGTDRTDYVSSDATFTWSEEAMLYPVVFSTSGQTRYPVGRTTDVRWFGTVARPRINDGVQPPTRTGDHIGVVVPAWGDSGGDHANFAAFGSDGTTETTELYRGGSLLATGSSEVSANVPAAKGSYRLLHKATRDATAEFPYSTATRTEWAFTSSAPRGRAGSEQLPLIQVDYALSTDAEGRAARDATLLVTPLHLPGAAHAALHTRRVEVSYDDGATWTTARISGRGDGKVSTELKAPKPARYLTLRVQAGDSHGNTVTQTVVRAAGITG